MVLVRTPSITGTPLVSEASTSATVPDDGTPKAREFVATCAMLSPQGNSEHLDGSAAFAAVATIDSLGGVPTVVTTASHHSYPGLAAAEEDRLNRVWDDGQRHWLGLSSSSRLVPVDNTGHMVQLDRPDVVIEQITQLL